MKRLAACLCAAALALGAAPARADDRAMIAVAAYTYLPGDADRPELTLRIPKGRGLDLVNLDVLGAHNLLSVEVDEFERPIFSSDAIDFGAKAAVAGVEWLAAGPHEFYCSVHGYDLMSGTLTIEQP